MLVHYFKFFIQFFDSIATVSPDFFSNYRTEFNWLPRVRDIPLHEMRNLFVLLDYLVMHLLRIEISDISFTLDFLWNQEIYEEPLEIHPSFQVIQQLNLHAYRELFYSFFGRFYDLSLELPLDENLCINTSRAIKLFNGNIDLISTQNYFDCMKYLLNYPMIDELIAVLKGFYIDGMFGELAEVLAEELQAVPSSEPFTLPTGAKTNLSKLVEILNGESQANFVSFLDKMVYDVDSLRFAYFFDDNRLPVQYSQPLSLANKSFFQDIYHMIDTNQRILKSMPDSIKVEDSLSHYCYIYGLPMLLMVFLNTMPFGVGLF